MANNRRTNISIVYDNKNITKDLNGMITSFTWKDSKGVSADEISLAVENHDLRWIDSWYPEQESTLEVSIECFDDYFPNGSSKINCGKFKIKNVNISMSSSSSTCTINGLSVASQNKTKGVVSSRSWKDVYISQIFKDIADEAGLGLSFISDDDVFLSGVTIQRKMSGTKYALNLAVKAGLTAKLINGTLVVYNEQRMGKNPPLRTFSLTGGRIISCSHTKDSFTATRKATAVKYFDSKNGKVVVMSSDGSEKSYGANETIPKDMSIANTSFGSKERALEYAKSIQRNGSTKNKNITMEVVGDPLLTVGSIIELDDSFKKIKGKYIIKSASHSISNSGYVTSIECTGV